MTIAGGVDRSWREQRFRAPRRGPVRHPGRTRPVLEPKADPQTCHVAILAPTACAVKGDEKRMLAARCDGYIPKPIDTPQLTSQVAKLLSRTSAGPGDERQP